MIPLDCRLETALAAAETALSALADKTSQQVGASEGLIFEAQRVFLRDPALRDSTRHKIEAEALNAEAALFEVADTFARQFEPLAKRERVFRKVAS